MQTLSIKLCLLVPAIVASFYLQLQAQVVPAFPNLTDYPQLRDFTLSANGTEAYLTVQSPAAALSVILRLSGKELGRQEIASFSGQYHDLEPFLSPDNLHLYFASNRPLSASDSATDYNLWWVSRSNVHAAWGEAQPVPGAINTPHNEFYPAVTEDNTLYYTSDSQGKDDIFVSNFQEGTYSEGRPLGTGVNSPGYEFNAFVAADGSFLLFSGYNRPDGQGSGDLYIAFRQEDGAWGKALNLGDKINSPAMEYCPFYHAETQTLYFTSRRSAFRSQPYTSVEALKESLSQYENGQSRLYKVRLNVRELQ